MADNDSNQPSNSNDNYQAMPDPEPPPAAVIVTVPDLAPPDPVIRIDDPGYVAPPPGSRGEPPNYRLPYESPIRSNADAPVHGSEPGGVAPPPPPPDEPGYTPPPDDAPYMPIGMDPPATTEPWTPKYEGEIPPWHRPSGAPMDEGFYVWLAHHGVQPGDPAKAYRMEEFKSNYLSMPQAAHDEFMRVGREDPEHHQFDLTGWKDIPGLPGQQYPPPTADKPYGGIPSIPPDPKPPEMILNDAQTNRQRAQADPYEGLWDNYGLTQRQAQPAERPRYDWTGRRVGNRVWDARLGRYV